MTITLLYASLLTILFAVMALRMSGLRFRTQTFFGSADESMTQLMRAHGNLAEHLPPFLIILLLLEMNNVAGGLLHLFGMIFLMCRVLHAFGVYRSSTFNYPRAIGAMGSWILLLLMGLYGIVLTF